MVDDNNYPEGVIYLARLKILLEKTAAWQRGEIELVDAPQLPERTRKRLEEKVLLRVWRDMMQEAAQYKS